MPNIWISTHPVERLADVVVGLLGVFPHEGTQLGPVNPVGFLDGPVFQPMVDSQPPRMHFKDALKGAVSIKPTNTFQSALLHDQFSNRA